MYLCSAPDRVQFDPAGSAAKSQGCGSDTGVRDVQLAIAVQKRLFPDKSPSASAFTPAYYDFLDLGDHRIGIALADVAGKGVAAALIVSVVQASLRISYRGRRNDFARLARREDEPLPASRDAIERLCHIFLRADR
ncbi:MAG TPA: hypothetical protein VFC21_01850 [Bryobacteraceae bacterium]|nr:hypothetical protein [Bryobacteraceae bacterium]